MSIEENKALAQHINEEVINNGNLDLVDSVVATNYVFHSLPGLPPGPQGFKQSVMIYRAAFPDLSATIDDVIAEGDKVVLRQTVRGTQQGTFANIPPTGKQVTFTGIFILRFVDGKIVEEWASLDQLGLLQQLGVL